MSRREVAEILGFPMELTSVTFFSFLFNSCIPTVVDVDMRQSHLRQISHTEMALLAGAPARSLWHTDSLWGIERKPGLWIQAIFFLCKPPPVRCNKMTERMPTPRPGSHGLVMPSSDDVTREANARLGESGPQCITYRPAGDMSQTPWQPWPVWVGFILLLFTEKHLFSFSFNTFPSDKKIQYEVKWLSIDE